MRNVIVIKSSLHPREILHVAMLGGKVIIVMKCYMWPGKVILLLENKQNFNLQYRPPMVGGDDVKMTIIIKRDCKNLIDDHKHLNIVTVLRRCQQLQSS